VSSSGRRACGIDITNNCRPERLSQESVHSKLSSTDVADKLWGPSRAHPLFPVPDWIAATGTVSASVERRAEAGHLGFGDLGKRFSVLKSYKEIRSSAHLRCGTRGHSRAGTVTQKSPIRSRDRENR
jgi:hypothetical protein